MLHIENELISYKIKDILELNDLSLDSSYQVQTNKIISSSFLNENINKENLEKIKYDQNFQVYLLHIIQNKMNKIIIDPTCLQFNEISTIINLLDFRNNHKVFTKYNQLSTNIVNDILNEYENLLKSDLGKEDNSFEISFSFYVTLLDSFIQVCLINSIDIKYKENITSIIELIQISINNIKSQIELTDYYLNILNKIYGKSILLFSNVKYIDTNDYSVEQLIYFFEDTFKKHIDTYLLLEKSSQNQGNYKTFLLTTTNLLLLMLKKLDSYKENYFYKLNIILKLYNKFFLKEERIFKGNEDFKNCLLGNFVFLYNEELSISYLELFHTILEKKKLSYNDIVIIHDLVLFNNNLDKNELFKTLNAIIHFKQENNDYYENYRLKIIDIVLNKFIKLEIFDEIDNHLKLVIEYISNIQHSSHLIASYSKIHLTISLYYSYLNKDNLTISKKHYYISKRMYSFDLYKNEYYHIAKKILLNNANAYLINNLIESDMPEKDLLIFGNTLMKEFADNKDNSLNNEILNKILDMINNNYTAQTAKNDLILLLTEKIFFSLCKCEIRESNENIEKSTEEVYNIFIQEINSSHYIIYKYSNFYEDNFKKIYEKQEGFIKKIVNTLLLLF